MTTGRINQVAFLSDTMTRTIPNADETRGRDGRGSRSYRARAARNGRSGGGGPQAGIAFYIRKHERSRVGQFGGSPLDWNMSAATRLAPRPQGGTRRRGTSSHSNSTEVGTQHRNPASPQGTQALRLRVMGAGGRQFGAPARSLPTRTARLPLMRLCVYATTIPTSEPWPREQVETPERDRARIARCKGSRRDKQQTGREGSRRDKQQAAGGHDRDNRARACLPQLERRRPGLGSEHVTPRGQGWRGEPTHGRAHGNLMPRLRQRRALLVIPELGGPHQTRRPGLQLASTGSGHRRRDTAASRRPRSSCQRLGTSTTNECHAHAVDKQPQCARWLGAGPENGGRNQVVAGRKTSH